MKVLQLPSLHRFRRANGYRIGALLLCLSALILAACSGDQGDHHQSVQTDNGNTISYSTLPQDVLVRVFYGGGKVGQLELTPEISIYGDGTFITGPGLQQQQGMLSSDALQHILHTLTSTDNLLQLHQQVFDDIPDQNVTLLQLSLNGKNYQFMYGPFGHLQEGTQAMHEYQQLGNAISAVRATLTGPVSAYTSQSMALLVYQTFRIDFTYRETSSLLNWPVSDFTLANAAAYECGVLPIDHTGPNADSGCLVYTIPHLAYLLNQQDLQPIKQALQGKQEGMFIENSSYYVVTLRPLLPDEIAHQQLAMYGSNIQDYTPIPLKTGTIPVAQTTH
jgi:hypothetical protein